MVESSDMNGGSKLPILLSGDDFLHQVTRKCHEDVMHG